MGRAGESGEKTDLPHPLASLLLEEGAEESASNRRSCGAAVAGSCCRGWWTAPGSNRRPPDYESVLGLFSSVRRRSSTSAPTCIHVDGGENVVGWAHGAS